MVYCLWTHFIELCAFVHLLGLVQTNVKSDDTFCFKEVNDSSCDHPSDGFNEVSVLFQVEVYKLNEEVSRLEQMVR